MAEVRGELWTRKVQSQAPHRKRCGALSTRRRSIDIAHFGQRLAIHRCRSDSRYRTCKALIELPD
jgi:hypothetical protein